MSHQEPAPSSTNFDKTKSCPKCSKSFAWKCSLVKHLKIHSGEKSFVCDICSKAFTRKDDLKRHLRIHSRKNEFKCEICGKSYIHKYLLTRHMRMHNQNHVCHVCHKSFPRSAHLKRHMSTHSEKTEFKCDLCSKTFKLKYYFTIHMSKHNSGQLNCKPCEFNCEICGKSYTQKYRLTRHMRMHNQNHVCHVCHKFFPRSANLKRHMITHSEKTEFKCDLCSKTFKLKHYFTIHMSKHSSGEFNCKLCDRSFASVKNQQQHVRESHSAVSVSSTRGVLPAILESSKRIKSEKRALNTFVNVYFEPLEEMQGDFILFFEEVAPHLQSKLNDELHVMRAIKWYGVVKATLVRFSEDGEEEHATPYFRSDVLLDLVSDTIEGHIQQAFSKIRKAFDEFVQRGSGWTLEKIEHFELCIAKYQPL